LESFSVVDEIKPGIFSDLLAVSLKVRPTGTTPFPPKDYWYKTAPDRESAEGAAEV